MWQLLFFYLFELFNGKIYFLNFMIRMCYHNCIDGLVFYYSAQHVFVSCQTINFKWKLNWKYFSLFFSFSIKRCCHKNNFKSLAKIKHKKAIQIHSWRLNRNSLWAVIHTKTCIIIVFERTNKKWNYSDSFSLCLTEKEIMNRGEGASFIKIYLLFELSVCVCTKFFRFLFSVQSKFYIKKSPY